MDILFKDKAVGFESPTALVFGGKLFIFGKNYYMME